MLNILLPKEFDLINLSLKPDKENSDSTNNIYYINKTICPKQI